MWQEGEFYFMPSVLLLQGAMYHFCSRKCKMSTISDKEVNSLGCSDA